MTPFFMRKDIMGECAQLEQFDEELYKVTGVSKSSYCWLHSPRAVHVNALNNLSQIHHADCIMQSTSDAACSGLFLVYQLVHHCLMAFTTAQGHVLNLSQNNDSGLMKRDAVFPAFQDVSWP